MKYSRQGNVCLGYSTQEKGEGEKEVVMREVLEHTASADRWLPTVAE